MRTEQLEAISADTPDGGIEPEEMSAGELPGRPIRKRLGPLTMILAALLVAGGAFYAGVSLEKSKVGSTSAVPNLASLLRGQGGGSAARGANAGGLGFPGGGFGGGTVGTVKLIDGSNVYLSESDGTVVKVATGPSTSISVTATGKLTDLHPGDSVTVAGSTGRDGTVIATSVQDSGASGTNPISSSSGSPSNSSNSGGPGGPGGGFGGPPGG